MKQMCECGEVDIVSYVKVSYFEQRFWLQILGDHARFIFNTLSPSEVELIHQAHHFLQLSDHLLEQANKMEAASKEKWIELAYHSYGLADQFRQFKLMLVSLHLECQVNIGLPPTFINHMVNEIEEYMRVLSYLVRGEVPPKLHSVHHHNLWLLDAAGHAAVIQSELDPTEKKMAKEAEKFQKTFENFYIKAREMAGFIRARQDLFPALQEFNKETALEIELFSCFLNELEEMRLDCRIMGTIMPLMADHMAREECYYLLKLHEVDPENVKLSSCDPTKPRVKE
jgi:hypothetical protein